MEVLDILAFYKLVSDIIKFLSTANRLLLVSRNVDIHTSDLLARVVLNPYRLNQLLSSGSWLYYNLLFLGLRVVRLRPLSERLDG